MRRCLTLGLFATALLAPLPAFAQDPNCPPGAWFCEETDVEPPAAAPPAKSAPAPAEEAPADRGPNRAPPPPPNQRRGATTVVIPPPPGQGAPPPVVVYQPVPSAPPPQVIIIAPGRVRPVPPPPPPPKPRWHREWGLNLRLEGVALGGDGRGAAHDAGMGGLGFSLRYRPVPAFALDFGLDLLGGKDYNGFERAEIPLTMSGILFVNPRSRVQFYFLGGFNYSHAHVQSDYESPLLVQDGWNRYSNDYEYVGGHGGIGLEFRLSKRVALNVDMIGFVRERVDDGTAPEFVDENTGRTTNSSGGGLFRGGLTFWW